MKNPNTLTKMTALAAALALCSTCLLGGCGNKAAASPDSISIQSEGEDVTELSILDKTSDSLELTAALDPDDFDGEITWTSSDAGVVKIASSEGNTCTLSLLKAGYAKITASAGDTSASCVVTVEKNQDQLSARDIALTIRDINYSVEKVNIFYAATYYDFVDRYGNSASSYGLDISLGVEGLADESCSFLDEGSTWKDYFMDEAERTMVQYQALCDYADANGITLDESGEAEIQEQIDQITSDAAENGFDDVDAYIASLYGDDATLELYKEFEEESALAQKVYNQYYDSLTYTPEEIAEHYTELGYTDEDENNYKVRSMRHILIMAEADEEGNYTDEAISAAHDKAEEIYSEWKSGAADEDSFAALAEEYSEDPGSASAGGLYEHIYKDEMIAGINDWLFDAGRVPGDTTVVDNNGNYVGTHIVFYVGEGDLYSTYLSESDLKDTDMTSWIKELTADYTTEEGAAYSSVGNF